MKKRVTFLVFVFVAVLLFTSCQIEAIVPEDQQTISGYIENKSLYQECVSFLSSLGYDALISKVDYMSTESTKDFEGLYIQNMEDNTATACNEPCLIALFENTGVKIVDYITRDGLDLCNFSFSLPSKNFDYGFYFVSEDKPVYFGDFEADLMENGKGFSYEQKASYGVKFTYYTEKIEDHYYYYEIA